MRFVYLVASILIVPVLAGWLRNNRRNIPKIWVIVGLCPFVIPTFHLYFAVISWPFWPGYVLGTEITFLDILVASLYFLLPSDRSNLPFRWSVLIYLATVLLSAVFAGVPMAAMFYVWQLARMFLVYVVVARACKDKTLLEALLTGMLLGLAYETLLVFWQRFVSGEFQTPGSFGHQNTLGMVTNLATFPMCALYFAGKRGWKPLSVPLMGIAVVVLTVSRATTGLAALGYVLSFVFAALRRWTPRLTMIALTTVLLVGALAPLLLDSFEERFAEVPLSDSYDERGALENAAEMMLADHPSGVGANNFVVAANTEGYYDRAKVAYTSRQAHVHNVYLLTAAETGYAGGAAFILLLLQPFLSALRTGWRNRTSDEGQFLLGCAVALLLVYLQSFFEWTFVTFSLQYMFALTAGMVAALTQELAYSSKSIASGVKGRKSIGARSPVRSWTGK